MYFLPQRSIRRGHWFDTDIVILTNLKKVHILVHIEKAGIVVFH